jgi:hypothetical protein
MRNMRMMSAVPSLFCLVCLYFLLAGCSLAPAMNHDVSDYFFTNDLASNRIILLNILRARDGAPLHFSELSQIRGQLSAGVTASTTFPFGPYSHATMVPRDLATLAGTVSSSPSFDIASLDTKDFTTGVMSPITPQTAEFFLNEGIDYRMVVLLLVSGIRPAGGSEMLLNAPNSSRVVCYDHRLGTNELPDHFRILEADEPCAGFSEPEYYAFLRIVNSVGRLYPVAVPEPPRPIGRPFDLDMNRDLRAVISIDPARYRLLPLSSGRFQLVTMPHGDTLVLCEERAAGPRIASILAVAGQSLQELPPSACDPRLDPDAEGDAASRPAAAAPVMVGKSPGTFVLQLRSTLEVIQYVGEVLALQQRETARYPTRPERCVTLEYEPLDGSTCDRGVLFHLRNTTGVLDPWGISISYNLQQWSLPPPKVCLGPDRCDHTLQTMSMISLLLNENKSAADIARTPAVQEVP